MMVHSLALVGREFICQCVPAASCAVVYIYHVRACGGGKCAVRPRPHARRWENVTMGTEVGRRPNVRRA